DGDSLIRTLDTNPMRLEIRPVEALALNQVSIRIGGTASTVTIRLIPADGSAEQVLVKQAPESNDLRDIVFTLDKSVMVEQINIEILNLHDGERAHVHLWEVSLN
ncbi:MAG: hypothetical protein Q8R09_03685, partial [Anaerolineaceae bacterium]|nr:hypothetical protein [Anaerolineaceae bacterium]